MTIIHKGCQSVATARAYHSYFKKLGLILLDSMEFYFPVLLKTLKRSRIFFFKNRF